MVVIHHQAKVNYPDCIVNKRIANTRRKLLATKEGYE